jgi:hypothetical protein
VRHIVMITCCIVAGCAGQSEHVNREQAKADPMGSDLRCILRISHRGTFADGAPMSRAAAVAHCKRAPGGAVVVIEDQRKRVWDKLAATMVVIEDDAIKAEWNETRLALQRAGVKMYVRGSLCDDPRPDACWPQTSAPNQPRPERIPHVPG